jgi:PKD repeat protein
MSKTPSKKGWSSIELGLLALVIVLLCGVAALVAFLVGDFALWETKQVEEAASATATVVPITDIQPGQPTAAPDEAQIITLAPAVGAPGTTIKVQGQGWPAQSRVVIYLLPLEPPRFAINSAMVDANGQFAVDIIVPSDPRWLAESPVPVLAELEDGTLSSQAMLNISSPTGGVADVTPIPVAVVPQATPTLAPPVAGVSQLTVNANALNVRQGPGTNYPVLGVLLNSQKAEITGRNADATWWQIKFPGTPDGVGWVSAAFATAENIANVPIVNAPPAPQPPPPTPTPSVPITYWRADYFNNPDLQGAPVLVRDDRQISFDWGLGSPAPELPVDNFSVRWTRTLNFQAGVYRFYARTDDGVRLWVDGALIINRWQEQSPTTHTADIYLADGPHSIRMEYYERAMGAVAMLSWERADQYADWRAEYFNNPDLQGAPVLVRNEPTIDYTWTNISPAPGTVPTQNFSVRWTRQVYFDGGDYQFKLRADDGVRVWVDNQIVIDHWRDGDTGWLEEYRNVPSGNREIRIEYYKRGAEAFITFTWQHRDRPDNPPIAVISAPSDGVAGLPVNFDGSRSRRGDNDIAKYYWEFGDGATAEGRQVSHTYGNTGDYKVRLTVVDRKGLRDRTSVNIRVNQNLVDTTPPIARINGPSTVQQGTGVTFDGSGSQSLSPIVDYQWNFGDGTIVSGSSVSHVYNKPGNFDVSLTVVAQNGLRGSARQQIRVDDVTIAAKPVAVINAPTSGQLGQQINFDASGSTAAGQIVSYAWNFGDGDSANGVNIPHTYQKGPGIYNVTLTVTDDQGQSNTANQQITITAAAQPTDTPTVTPNVPTNTPPPPTDTPVPQATATTLPQPVPTDTAVTQATTLPAPLPTDTPVPPQAATDTPVPAPTDTPVPQATPTPPPQPPVAVINGPNQAIVGDGLLFDGSLSQSSSPIVGWAWDYGDGVVENSGMGVGHTYGAPGDYVVTLTITDQNGLSSSATQNVRIDPPAVVLPAPTNTPVPQVTPPPPVPTNTPVPQATPTPPPQPPVAVLSGPSTGQVGTMIGLDGSQSQSSSPIVSWLWDYGDGISESSGMAVPHIYNAPGVYQVTLTVTDQNGLSSTDTLSIDIQGATPIPLPAQPMPKVAP